MTIIIIRNNHYDFVTTMADKGFEQRIERKSWTQMYDHDGKIELFKDVVVWKRKS